MRKLTQLFQDAKIYSNRAACYTKLNAFDLTIKDCDTSISMDPTFVKAYLRKANVLKAMGQARMQWRFTAKPWSLIPTQTRPRMDTETAPSGCRAVAVAERTLRRCEGMP